MACGRGFLQHNSLAIVAEHSADPGLGLPATDHPHARPRGRDPHRSGCTATANRSCGNAASAGSDRHRRGPAGSMSPIAAPITSRRCRRPGAGPPLPLPRLQGPRDRGGCHGRGPDGGISSRSSARCRRRPMGRWSSPAKGVAPQRTAPVAHGGRGGVDPRAPTGAVGPPRLDAGPRSGSSGSGSRRPPADVEEPLEWILLSSLPAADARAVAPAVRLVCMSPADRGLSPGGEDGLRRGGPAVRDGRGDVADAGRAGDRGGARAAIAVVGP